MTQDATLIVRRADNFDGGVQGTFFEMPLSKLQNGFLSPSLIVNYKRGFTKTAEIDRLLSWVDSEVSLWLYDPVGGHPVCGEAKLVWFFNDDGEGTH